MYNGTWHDTTYYPTGSFHPSKGSPNATFAFNGTKCNICILRHRFLNDDPQGFSNMTFYIDNEFVDNKTYQYNVLVYSNTSMIPGEHIFVLQNGQEGGGGNKSLTLFDYLIYSHEDGSNISMSTLATSENSGSKISTGSVSAALIGGTVGAIVGALITVTAIWFILKRRKLGIIGLYYPKAASEEQHNILAKPHTADSSSLPHWNAHEDGHLPQIPYWIR
ncbi:hypothetical protein BDQ17DRAFT_1380793, partial [Cyathus striatus]